MPASSPGPSVLSHFVSEGFAISAPPVAVSAPPAVSSGATKRWDAPLSLPAVKRGKFSDALHSVTGPAAAESQALARQRAYASTSRAPRDSKLRTWNALTGRAGFIEGEMSPQVLETVMGALISSNYRSSISYMSVAKQAFIRTGGIWTDELQLAFVDMVRAGVRGLGSGKQADPFPILDLAACSVSAAPLVEGGPSFAKQATIAGPLWALSGPIC